jgi:small subunit ribosomal protein S1
MQQQAREMTERFRQLLATGDYDYERPRPGQVLEATILSISEHDIVVGLDSKQDGIIPPQDLQLVDDEYVESLEEGDRIPVVVMRRRLGEPGVRVSLNKGLQQRDWLRMEELEDTGEVIEVEVTDTNRGGLVVQAGGLRGFVPNSLIGSLTNAGPDDTPVSGKDDLIGLTLEVVVTEVNQRRRRLVLSRRAVQRRMRHQLLDEIQPGEVRRGVVRNIVSFGAFVDLGGIDGLIHVSEIDWGHVDRVEDVLSVGDQLDVYVLRVDRERQRIALSRKRLLPDPWDTLVTEMEVGDTVAGTVTHVVDFGAFVDVGQGVEGLVHESVLQQMGISRDQIVPQMGVVVRILGIDRERHRISLGLVEPEDTSDEIPDEADESLSPAQA